MANYHSTKLKEGAKAPGFNVKDQDGKPVSLKDFEGKKLIIYFYPKDDTAGCTAESCNLRDNYAAFKKQGYEILGVSADDEKKHRKFIKKHRLPFSLLADSDKRMINAYDVWGKKTLFGITYDGIIRTTFVINEAGIIKKIITDVDTKNHTKQLLI